MFKNLITKFMEKTLITKIIIVTSSVVVIGGATAGAIFIPKQVEKHKQEQLEIQLQQEKEEDLANMSIVLSKDKISIPYKGVTQGITIERYEKLDNVMPYEEGNVLDKEKLTEVLKELFVESYTGGELTVEFDENINGYTRGDYPITFIVTSEKGNTKSETATIEVYNYFSVAVSIQERNKTIIKGSTIDIMEGVTFESNLPKEEQGEIKAEGTVDVNTVGTYTIKYTYIPKEGADEVALGGDDVIRTYKVIEEQKVKQNVTYKLQSTINTVGSLSFSGNKFYIEEGVKNGGGVRAEGTYIEKNGIIKFTETSWGDEGEQVEETTIYTGEISDNGKTITVIYESGDKSIFKLK